MYKRPLFFLSGIARSGSTLLGSILNQNPEIYVSPTSPLMDLYCLFEQNINTLKQQYTFDDDKVKKQIDDNLANTFYSHIPNSYIIDKHRGWPKNIANIKRCVTPNPKILCTYRPLAENITSFLKLIRNDPNNSVDATLRKRGLEINTYNRAMLLWHEYSNDPWYSLKTGLETDPYCIHIIEYDRLTSDPVGEIMNVYKFLEIEPFEHDFSHITNTCAESKDEAWGFKDLHNIRPSIQKTSDNPLTVLGPELVHYFNELDNQLRIVR